MPAKSSRRVALAVSVGTLIEGHDNLLYGYFASILAEQFFPRSDPTAAPPRSARRSASPSSRPRCATREPASRTTSA